MLLSHEASVTNVYTQDTMSTALHHRGQNIDTINSVLANWAQPGIEPGTSRTRSIPEAGIILLDHKIKKETSKPRNLHLCITYTIPWGEHVAPMQVSKFLGFLHDFFVS